MVKNLPADAGDMGLILEPGTIPGGGDGNPLQSSCLGKSHAQRRLVATAHGVTHSQTQVSN